MRPITSARAIMSFAFAKQSWKTAPWEDLLHLLDEGIGAFVMGLVFLFSAFMPFGTAIKDVLDPSILSWLPLVFANFPSNIGFWILGFFLLALPAAVITRIILWLRRPKEQ